MLTGGPAAEEPGGQRPDRQRGESARRTEPQEGARAE